jgi:hypothetical protein
MTDERRLALAHGVFNVLGGLWPLVSMRTFELVSGPKVDRWLVRTVCGLMVANGLVQVGAARSGEGLRQARQVGLGTAGVLAVVDVVYVAAGRISRVYLVDAAMEAGWVAAWAAARARAR